MRTVLALLGIVLFLAGCNEAFDPNGPYQERTVVYGILSATTDTQFVRVYSTHPAHIGTGTEITDAAVVVSGPAGTHAFSDTTIAGFNADGNPVSIHAYVAYGFPLEANKVYRLAIDSPELGTVTSQARSLFLASMYIVGSGALANPNLTNSFSLTVIPGRQTRAYVARMFIEYEVLAGGMWDIRREEVPIDRVIRDGHSVAAYPVPLPVGVRPYGGVQGSESVIISTGVYKTTLANLYQAYAGQTMHLLNAVFILTQLDDNLYGYYSVVNGFPSSNTIRLDEPDFTNIEGGLGIFGTTSTTVVSDSLPDHVSF